MYTFYNPHPQGKLVSDCVKRAITKATGKPYHDVQLELNRYKKITGSARFNDNTNWKPYVEKVLKDEKISFPAVAGKPRMNGERFCKAYPTGTYLLRMAKHLVCCIDGVLYDTWDSSECCVYNAWRIR